ncbi:hypothetical protein D9756_010922 [Leucocoprinus leucothites]|uniref:non-specific serine/threonine protein kinase n=1 Tax=Leucocoprinus leucothites TaxID=201217 RepID=A0A8H5CQE7_9AGAR|nr:hypothetical protein D9756_010922 [Leucoagaricus leucothites]
MMETPFINDPLTSPCKFKHSSCTSMAFLRVQFPTSWPGWNTPECTLAPILTTTADSAAPTKILNNLNDKPLTVSVDPKTNADYYSDSPVFRAHFLRSTGSAATTTPVALKFAMRDDLIEDLVEEANIYAGVLSSLQGAAIPYCYGLYVGTMNDGQTVGCLVLEYWGECLRRPFDRLPVDLRLRILQKLGEIHKQGLIHGDFAERNVLERNGDIRIIDFDQTIRHDCQCHSNFRPGEKLPDDDKFGCDQLWESPNNNAHTPPHMDVPQAQLFHQVSSAHQDSQVNTNYYYHHSADPSTESS